MQSIKFSTAIRLIATALLAFSMHVVSAEMSKPQELVEKARITFGKFLTDPDVMEGFKKYVGDAQAIFIVPQLLKAGFIVGGSGGTGVLLVRDKKTGAWSYPAFYTMGAGSIGLQIGAESAEVVLLVMTEKGVNSMLSSSFKVGTAVSAAAGPVGAGAGAATADILSYSLSQGAFVGAVFDGSVISTKDDWNSEYYGKSLTPVDIIVHRSVSNEAAEGLRASIAKATKR